MADEFDQYKAKPQGDEFDEYKVKPAQAPAERHWWQASPEELAERKSATANSPMPGSFEGHPENIGEYVPASAGEVYGGVRDIGHGNVAHGLHRVFSGVSNAAAPIMALSAPAALSYPVSTAVGLAGSYGGQKLAEKTAESFGASPDQQDVAGDVGGLLGGIAGVRGVQAGTRILANRAPGLYQTALKPSTTMRPEVADRVIQTGLRENIPVGEGGLEKLYANKDIINQEIADIIGKNPERTISPTAVAERVRPTELTFAQQVNPEADLNAIHGSKAEFLRKHTVEQPFTKIDFRPVDGGPIGAVPVGAGSVSRIEPIPGPMAQREKIGTYKQLEGKYGELGSADIESQKALARGLKEEIAAQYPEVEAPNLRESRLIELQKPLERAVLRSGNNQRIDIGAPLMAGATEAVTGSAPIAAAVGTGRGLMANPFVRSKLAISLYNAGVKPKFNPMTFGVGLQGARHAIFDTPDDRENQQ